MAIRIRHLCLITYGIILNKEEEKETIDLGPEFEELSRITTVFFQGILMELDELAPALSCNSNPDIKSAKDAITETVHSLEVAFLELSRSYPSVCEDVTTHVEAESFAEEKAAVAEILSRIDDTIVSLLEQFHVKHCCPEYAAKVFPKLTRATEELRLRVTMLPDEEGELTNVSHEICGNVIDFEGIEAGRIITHVRTNKTTAGISGPA